MPKVKPEDKDEEFTPGKSRKKGLYNPSLDERGIWKELQKLKCRTSIILGETSLISLGKIIKAWGGVKNGNYRGCNKKEEKLIKWHAI